VGNAARQLSILRIMVGLLFMQYGLVKLFGFPTGAGFPAFLSQTWATDSTYRVLSFRFTASTR